MREALEHASLSQVTGLFEAGAKTDLREIIDADFEILEVALKHKVGCKDPEGLFLYILQDSDESILEVQLDFIKSLNLPISPKVLECLWVTADGGALASWAKSGFPIKPEKWTPAMQRRVNTFLDDMAVDEQGMSFQHFSDIFQALKPHISDSFDPFSRFRGTKASNELWQNTIRECVNSEDIISFFLEAGIVPQERCSRTFQMSNNTALSWPLCMALAGEEGLFRLMMTDEKQRTLLKEDLTPTGKRNFFDRFDNDSISAYAYSFLVDELMSLDFDFSQTDEEGNTFFHRWFSSLEMAHDWDDSQYKTALSPKAMEVLQTHFDIWYNAVNHDGERCLEVNDFSGLFIQTGREPEFMKKDDLVSYFEKLKLKSALPKSHHHRTSPRI